MKRIALLAISMAAMTAPFLAQAQAKPEEVIKYRQSVFKVIGWNFGAMAAMAKGEVPYNKETFSRHATNVEFVSRLALEGFPPGTENGETKAKPAIWSKLEDFKAKMGKMNDEAAKLAQIARSGGFDEIKKQFGSTGASCKSCHDDYKNK